MLFNSDAFLFAFLPITLAGFMVCAACARRAAVIWLIAASLFFYGWWNPVHLWVPIASAVVNFAIAVLIDRRRNHARFNKLLLVAGVTANVLFLVYFKSLISPWFGAPGGTGSFSITFAIAIPLGISFITFQQIAFLVDTYRKRIVAPGPAEYAFFLLFFPQLVMGPILHYRDIAPQLSVPGFGRLKLDDIACGLSIFAVGLFKKVMIADNIAPYVNRVFDMLAQGAAITPFDAWGAAIAFQFQLYFDFSGYADMAIGIGRLFGMRLPINFDAPYRAVDRFDLWRRWHITFSAFMRQYVFFPLAKNQLMPLPAWAALVITMIIAGLWHGLGWTFLLWGLIQALLLLGGHLVRHFRRARTGGNYKSGISLGARITFTFLITALMGVLFRSQNLETAQNVYASLIGMDGFSVPRQIALVWEATLGSLLGTLGLPLMSLPVVRPAMSWNDLYLLAFAAAIVWLAPTTHRLFEGVWTAIEPRAARDVPRSIENPIERRVRFSLTFGWAIFIASLLCISILFLDRASRYIYYQF